MFHRQSSNNLPGWLWFFLILPLVLIVALLYKRQRLPVVIDQKLRRIIGETPRYSEPDSIPLNMGDMHPSAVPYENTPVDDEAIAPAARFNDEVLSDSSEMALGLDDEDMAMDRAASAETINEQNEIPGAETSLDEVVLDDLKVIEGIGPAIASLLHEHGVHTYHDLARTPVVRLQDILSEARLNRLSDPSTWPEQAGLAAEGRWDALNELQRSLKAGRRKNG